MKQQIELEEIAELSSEARKKLHLWLLEHDYPTVFVPLGVLIEFLKQYTSFAIYMDMLIIARNDYMKFEGRELHIAYVELCNALWVAVRSVLEDKE